MAQKITFRGVTLKRFTMGMNNDGVSYTRITFSADFSDPVREAMKWDPLPNGYGGGDLRGELNGVDMKISPSARDLAKYGFDMPIRKIEGFQVVALKQGDDKPDEVELRFTVLTQSKRAYKTLGEWIDNIGKAKAALQATYQDEENGQMSIVGQAIKDADEYQQRLENSKGTN